MGVEVLLSFSNSRKGVVALAYDHFGHASSGTWTSMCPLLGRSEGPPKCDMRLFGTSTPMGSWGSFTITGGLLTLHERDESGKPALVAELRYFPKLGGKSNKDIQEGRFEGPFRVYRAHMIEDSPLGTWNLLGTGERAMGYDLQLTSTAADDDF